MLFFSTTAYGLSWPHVPKDGSGGKLKSQQASLTPTSTDISAVPAAHLLLHLSHKHLGNRCLTLGPWEAANAVMNLSSPLPCSCL